MHYSARYHLVTVWHNCRIDAELLQHKLQGLGFLYSGLFCLCNLLGTRFPLSNACEARDPFIPFAFFRKYSELTGLLLMKVNGCFLRRCHVLVCIPFNFVMQRQFISICLNRGSQSRDPIATGCFALLFVWCNVRNDIVSLGLFIQTAGEQESIDFNPLCEEPSFKIYKMTCVCKQRMRARHQEWPVRWSVARNV